MIYYFSGTGNSKYVAKKIAEKTGDNLVSLNEYIKKGQSINCDDEKVVFCTPTYSWQIPPVVKKLINKGTFKSKSKVYFVMTCGDDIGNAEKYCRSLCEKVDFDFMGVKNVVMPENYIAMFSSPSNEEAKEIIAKADAVIDSIANTIAENKQLDCPDISFSGKMKSSIVNKLFFTICVKDKSFYAKDECNGCGLCAKLCPLNNITVDKKPQWHGNCTHCMACICHCPKEAIEYGNKSKGQNRYHI